MNAKRIWSKDKVHLLAPENIAKIELALAEGYIFGHQYHYYGGMGYTVWSMSSIMDFLSYVNNKSKPGDLYVIWSNVQLESKGQVLVKAHFYESNNLNLISDTQLQTINEYLSTDRNEIIAVYYRPDMTEARMFEQDEIVDFLELAQDYNQFGGGVAVFPMKDIDDKAHILVEAKYPNENGEVPLGGAY